jgi:hypothetical protein
MAKVTKDQKETAEIMFQLQQQAALKDIRSEVDEELAELLSLLCAQGRFTVFNSRTGGFVNAEHVTMNGPFFQVNIAEDAEVGVCRDTPQPPTDNITLNA